MFDSGVSIQSHLTVQSAGWGVAARSQIASNYKHQFELIYQEYFIVIYKENYCYVINVQAFV